MEPVCSQTDWLCLLANYSYSDNVFTYLMIILTVIKLQQTSYSHHFWYICEDTSVLGL